MNDERVAGGYLVVQGIGAALWWVSLYASPTVRGWFVAEAGWPVAPHWPSLRSPATRH